LLIKLRFGLRNGGVEQDLSCAINRSFFVHPGASRVLPVGGGAVALVDITTRELDATPALPVARRPPLVLVLLPDFFTQFFSFFLGHLLVIRKIWLGRL